MKNILGYADRNNNFSDTKSFFTKMREKSLGYNIQ
jgi:hypothetical protein